jgi:hypothetical protein
MKRCIFIFLVLVCVNQVGAKEYELDIKPPSKHLYFNDLQLIEQFDTVTVFITAGKKDYRIADTFYAFAELIGRDNGATSVDVGDYKKYTQILSRLNCRPIRTEELPAVVFTAKNQGFCQVFPLTNPNELAEILFTIQRNLSCPGDLVVDQGALEARKAVRELSESVKQLKAVKRAAYALIDFMAEQMRVTCKK